MAREFEGYRETIGRLNEAYPGREVLTAEEIGRFINRSARTVARKFRLVDGGTTKEVVARWLCKTYRPVT